MAGFVVCNACGTRIKDDREWCLMCGKALPRNDPETLAHALKISRARTFIAGTIVSLAVLATGAILWSTREPAHDEVARPAAGAAAQPAAPVPTDEAPPAETVAAPESVLADHGAFVDASRTGVAPFATGDFESARVAYEQGLAKSPDDAETLNSLGQVLIRLGRLSDAVPRFENAAALAPEKWVYRFNLAHAFGRLEQWDRAATAYREAAKLLPTDYATQFNLGMALHKMGDEVGAVSEFQKAIQLAPGQPSFRVSLGISLEKIGRVSDAIAQYRRYLEMLPSASDAPQVKAHVDALVARQAGERSRS